MVMVIRRGFRRGIVSPCIDYPDTPFQTNPLITLIPTHPPISNKSTTENPIAISVSTSYPHTRSLPVSRTI